LGHDRPVGGAGVDRDPAAPLTPAISVALCVGLGGGGGATLSCSINDSRKPAAFFVGGRSGPIFADSWLLLSITASDAKLFGHKLIRRHHPRLPPLVCWRTNRISSADCNKKFQMRRWACWVGRCGRMEAAGRWSQGRRWPGTNPAVAAARCSSSRTRCRPDVRAPRQCTCQSSGWSVCCLAPADPVSYPSRPGGVGCPFQVRTGSAAGTRA
jgi:hypothetical protein